MLFMEDKVYVCITVWGNFDSLCESLGGSVLILLNVADSRLIRVSGIYPNWHRTNLKAVIISAACESVSQTSCINEASYTTIYTTRISFIEQRPAMPSVISDWVLDLLSVCCILACIPVFPLNFVSVIYLPIHYLVSCAQSRRVGCHVGYAFVIRIPSFVYATEKLSAVVHFSYVNRRMVWKLAFVVTHRGGCSRFTDRRRRNAAAG